MWDSDSMGVPVLFQGQLNFLLWQNKPCGDTESGMFLMQSNWNSSSLAVMKAMKEQGDPECRRPRVRPPPQPGRRERCYPPVFPELREGRLRDGGGAGESC